MALPRSFSHNPQPSTKGSSRRELKQFKSYIHRPWTHPLSQLGSLNNLNFEQFFDLHALIASKYLIGYLRIVRPGFMDEGFVNFDILAECIDDEGSFKAPPETLQFYVHQSFKTNVSALLSGINREAIAIQKVCFLYILCYTLSVYVSDVYLYRFVYVLCYTFL